jgi:hypothetical protein
MNRDHLRIFDAIGRHAVNEGLASGRISLDGMNLYRWGWWTEPVHHRTIGGVPLIAQFGDWENGKCRWLTTAWPKPTFCGDIRRDGHLPMMKMGALVARGTVSRRGGLVIDPPSRIVPSLYCPKASFDRAYQMTGLMEEAPCPWFEQMAVAA